ncbi:hypothetical protein DLM75_07980 [Leptospira stimsonii]|uniref:Uncharacterized protein n=1 Tax=Leptospira stimsonii TaxID=2202203 RepID=A0A396ZGM2_9LEPT|nr:hypothetical protein DLM75_07980 [Leptospira stimsonii]
MEEGLKKVFTLFSFSRDGLYTIQNGGVPAFFFRSRGKLIKQRSITHRTLGFPIFLFSHTVAKGKEICNWIKVRIRSYGGKSIH